MSSDSPAGSSQQLNKETSGGGSAEVSDAAAFVGHLVEHYRTCLDHRGGAMGGMLAFRRTEHVLASERLSDSWRSRAGEFRVPNNSPFLLLRHEPFHRLEDSIFLVTGLHPDFGMFLGMITPTGRLKLVEA